VTGGNTGLGKEAARHFVRLSAAKVILGCRDVKKGEAAKADIENTTQIKDIVVVWQLDMASYDSVRDFRRKVADLERLDAVVLNAGVATPHFKLIEGFESTILVNVISTFLLALLILPVLRESAVKYDITPHLTIVASDAHEQVFYSLSLRRGG